MRKTTLAAIDLLGQRRRGTSLNRTRIAIGIAALLAGTAVLAGCGSEDAGAAPTAPPSVSATSTKPMDPFEARTLGEWQRQTVSRIIEIGHSRGESEAAILAALTASRAESGWYNQNSG